MAVRVFGALADVMAPIINRLELKISTQRRDLNITSFLPCYSIDRIILRLSFQNAAIMSEIAVGEVVNVIVAVAFIALVVSWATSPKETPEQKTIRTTLGFKPKHITSEMVSPKQMPYL